MISFLVLIFSLTGIAFSCEIHLPSHLVILSKSSRISRSAAHTRCSPEDLKNVEDTLLGIEGKVTNNQLAELLKQKGSKVLVYPPLIKIQHLISLVREEVKLPTGTTLEGIEVSAEDDFISLSQDDTYQIECQGCSFQSKQPMTLLVQNSMGQPRKTTFVASFKKLIKAYRVTSFHPAFAPIEVSHLKEELVEAIPYTDLIDDLSSLRFFKTNKPIRPGDLLRSADLRGENLVRAGTRTEVLIENKMLKLKTFGLSRNNGSWGQLVEVFHPERNKKYLGKVIDINKVLVEL